MELYSRHPTALGNGRQAIMEPLNEIMARTMPRRPSHLTPQPHPYQGEQSAERRAQTESAQLPPARRRLPEQAPQSLPTNSSTHPDAPYPYSNGTSYRSHQ